jgi:hypothetical protein
MECGEYGSLLKQIRFGQAEHLGEDCWRVTLPGNSRTLPVRAAPWRLITILPKNWQPPTSAAPCSPTMGGMPMSDRHAPVNAIEDAGIPSDKRAAPCLRREPPWS